MLGDREPDRSGYALPTPPFAWPGDAVPLRQRHRRQVPNPRPLRHHKASPPQLPTCRELLPIRRQTSDSPTRHRCLSRRGEPGQAAEPGPPPSVAAWPSTAPPQPSSYWPPPAPPSTAGSGMPPPPPREHDADGDGWCCRGPPGTGSSSPSCGVRSSSPAPDGDQLDHCQQQSQPIESQHNTVVNDFNNRNRRWTTRSRCPALHDDRRAFVHRTWPRQHRSGGSPRISGP